MSQRPSQTEVTGRGTPALSPDVTVRAARDRSHSQGDLPNPDGMSLPGEQGAGEEALPESPPSGLQPWPPGGPAFLESTAILDGRRKIVLTI